jgi:hypothetical protein
MTHVPNTNRRRLVCLWLRILGFCVVATFPPWESTYRVDSLVVVDRMGIASLRTRRLKEPEWTPNAYSLSGPS